MRSLEEEARGLSESPWSELDSWPGHSWITQRIRVRGEVSQASLRLAVGVSISGRLPKTRRTVGGGPGAELVLVQPHIAPLDPAIPHTALRGLASTLKVGSIDLLLKVVHSQLE